MCNRTMCWANMVRGELQPSVLISPPSTIAHSVHTVTSMYIGCPGDQECSKRKIPNIRNGAYVHTVSVHVSILYPCDANSCRQEMNLSIGQIGECTVSLDMVSDVSKGCRMIFTFCSIEINIYDRKGFEIMAMQMSLLQLCRLGGLLC